MRPRSGYLRLDRMELFLRLSCCKGFYTIEFLKREPISPERSHGMQFKLQLKRNIIFLGIFFLVRIASAKDKIHISAPDDGSPMTYTKIFLNKSYKDLGNEVFYENLPAERGLIKLEKGQVDADLIRSPYVEETNKILRVNISLGKIKFYVVTLKQSGFSPKATADLENHIGAVLLGYRVAEKLSETSRRTEKVRSVAQLIRLLEKNRVDYILTPGKIKDPRDLFYQFSIYSDDVYHMVSYKMKSLIPNLETAFKKNLTPELKEKIQHEIDGD